MEESWFLVAVQRSTRKNPTLKSDSPRVRIGYHGTTFPVRASRPATAVIFHLETVRHARADQPRIHFRLALQRTENLMVG
ncbi:hypothetical protein, partial [Sinorhizobium psoraleae]|uniref:hypothetical protein n=1 Tax=Sinorhizobium psoraleae TaxID=520838 RepID=UPI001AEE5FF5